MMKIYKYLAATITAALFSAALYAQVKTDGKTTEYDGIVRFDKTIHDFGDLTVG